MAWVGLRLVVVFLASLVAVVLCADNATTAAPATTTPAPATTTPKPRTPGILESIETFISAIPIGLATACQTSAQAVKNFFTNPWW